MFGRKKQKSARTPISWGGGGIPLSVKQGGGGDASIHWYGRSWGLHRGKIFLIIGCALALFGTLSSLGFINGPNWPSFGGSRVNIMSGQLVYNNNNLKVAKNYYIGQEHLIAWSGAVTVVAKEDHGDYEFVGGVSINNFNYIVDCNWIPSISEVCKVYAANILIDTFHDKDIDNCWFRYSQGKLVARTCQSNRLLLIYPWVVPAGIAGN